MSDDKLLVSLVTRMSDNLDDLREKISSLEGEIKPLARCLEEHIDQDKLIYQEISKIHDLDTRQNELLAEHIRATRSLEDRMAHVDGQGVEDPDEKARSLKRRLERIERPFNWLNGTWKVILGASALIGAIAVIIRFLSRF